MIPVHTPLLLGREAEYLQECVASGWISSEGPFVARFEQAFAERTGRRHGIAVANGSAALEVALQALGIGPGDEVILPAFTIIACAAAVVRCGARPVFVDVLPDTWNMDVSQVEARISPRTRAIMPVHIFGLPVDMEPLLALARRHGLLIIEDAAEAHGLDLNGRPCGSFGELGTFSFYANKLITTGEGGMLVTDDAALAERCRSLRNHCFQAERRFVHEELGFNYRMTNLQAAVGLAQLEQQDELLRRKHELGAYYQQALAGIPGLQLPLPTVPGAHNTYWVFGLLLDESLPFDAHEAMRRLGDLGIGTRPFFWPLHEQPALQRLGLTEGYQLPVAERLGRRGFYIPGSPGLSGDEREQVVAAVRSVLKSAA